MLKIARARLFCKLINTINISKPITECRSGTPAMANSSLRKIPLISPKTIFARGSAALIQSISFLLFLNRLGFAGTGFAHLKCTRKIMIAGETSLARRTYLTQGGAITIFC